jgi:hypothetical protein
VGQKTLIYLKGEGDTEEWIMKAINCVTKLQLGKDTAQEHSNVPSPKFA